MNCYKCQSNNIFIEKCAKIISPNVYELYDKYLCRVCKVFKKIGVSEIDKNTDNTRKLLTGNYYVNSKGDVVHKSKGKKLKELAEEAQEEINLDNIFG